MERDECGELLIESLDISSEAKAYLARFGNEWVFDIYNIWERHPYIYPPIDYWLNFKYVLEAARCLQSIGCWDNPEELEEYDKQLREVLSRIE